MVPGATRAASAAPGEPRRALALKVATGAAFVWALAAVVVVVLTFADAAGMPLSEPSFGAQLMASVWSIDTLRVMVAVGHGGLRRGHRRSPRDDAGCHGGAHRRRPLRGARARACRARGRLVGPRDGRQRPRRAPRRRLAVARWSARARRAAPLARRLARRRGAALLQPRPVVLRHRGRLGSHVRLDAPLGVADLTTDYGRARARQGAGLRGARGRRLVAPAGDAGAHRRRGRRAFARLAVGEAVVMGAGRGHRDGARAHSPAGARDASATRPRPSRSPASPRRPRRRAMSWLTAWRVEWLFLAVGLLAIGLYVAGVVRLRRRGDALAGAAHGDLGARLVALHLRDQRGARHLRARRLLLAHDAAHVRGDGRADLPRARRPRHAGPAHAAPAPRRHARTARAGARARPLAASWRCSATPSSPRRSSS